MDRTNMGRARKVRARASFRPTLETLESREVLSATPLTGIQGPSSSATPYLVPVAPAVQFTSIMTVGDSVNTKPDGVTPYKAVGIMDGLGAYDNGDGTFTLLMNHELPVSINSSGVATPVGVARAHGNAGAFVSRWTINKSDLSVAKVEDFLANVTSIYLSDNDPATGAVHAGFRAGDTTIIARLCSADLADPGAYGWTDPSTGIFYGTDARIFQSGEESGGIATSAAAGGDLGPEARIDFGRQFAFIATDDSRLAGDQSRTAYELPHAGLFPWENNLASPYAQRKTVVVGMDDSTGGQLYFWVGDKQTTGNVVERAGLTRQSAADQLYVLRVDNLIPDSTGATNEIRTTPLSGRFSLQAEGDVSGLTFAQLEAKSDSVGGTQFFRPEDGQWDPNNPNDYYFVTTDQYDQVKDGVGTTVGRSRLYRLRFDDITNPAAGGTIEALLDGTEAGNMFDNMTVDGDGKVWIQEDVGNQDHNSKIWMYDIATDDLVLVAKHDPARFGDLVDADNNPATPPAVTAPTSPFTRDEESSGIIDVSHILGAGKFLVDVQAHYSLGGELVEGGQLLLMDTNVPTATLSGGVLTVQGTVNDDDISVTRHGQNLTVSVNGQTFTFDNKKVSRLSIDAGAGSDSVSADANVQQAAILLGGLGNDSISAGGGRSILVGGAGADTLAGGSDSDIVIGGNTTADLTAVLDAWLANGAYKKRVDALASLLTSTTVTEDGAADTLSGGGNLDWFWAYGLDSVTLQPSERQN